MSTATTYGQLAANCNFRIFLPFLDMTCIYSTHLSEAKSYMITDLRLFILILRNIILVQHLLA